MYNAAERKDVKLAEKESKRRDKDRRHVVRSIMESSAGRDYTLQFLERTHVFTSSFQPNALQMAFSEGERNVGLQLLNDIMQACPEKYVQMMEERNARDLALDTARNRSGSDPDPGSEPGDEDGPVDPIQYYPSERRV